MRERNINIMNEKKKVLYTQKKIIKGYYTFALKFGNLGKMKKFLKNTICQFDERNGYTE